MFKKKLKILYVIIILVEISLVELKLKFLAFYHTQIGVICGLKLSKMSVYQTFSLNYVLTFPIFVYNLICNTLEL